MNSRSSIIEVLWLVYVLSTVLIVYILWLNQGQDKTKIQYLIKKLVKLDQSLDISNTIERPCDPMFRVNDLYGLCWKKRRGRRKVGLSTNLFSIKGIDIWPNFYPRVKRCNEIAIDRPFSDITDAHNIIH